MCVVCGVDAGLRVPYLSVQLLSWRLTRSIIQSISSRGVSAGAGRDKKEKFKREPGKPGSVNKFSGQC